MIVVLAALQGLALLLVIVRLLPGRRRRPPVAPVPEGLEGSSVSVVVATLNEARRIGPCLAGLAKQGAPLREVIVVDSHSKDATPAMVEEIAARDRRFRLVNDPPLPTGWVGKVWALQHGLGEATSEWVLGIDADTEPQPGMVAAVVQAAQAMRYDVVSFAPQFADMTSAEQWLQPSMLLTLVYRFGAAGMADPPPDRVMANGQCFLARREVLLANGGYEVSRQSWADDVTLARWLASRGVRVGFLDGSRLYKVRAYDSLGHMWREWGRSFDLSDATTRVRQWFDVLYIALAQGMPWLVLLAFALGALSAQTPAGLVLLRLNQTLVAIRVLMLLALWGSYERRSMGFWLSPLADPVAAWRLILSTVRRPKGWRGRTFTLGSAPDPSR
ncbi:MAG TPA: glycosyltransferase family 2 protein [Gemmatimonadaceae bacterium]|nr:glycosyltransferase family 2 protein [Gemmatimonadaceae bacterium]